MSALSLLWQLFSVFFKIGAVTFGGGYAMIPILERELAQKRGWTTEEELMDYYAIAQITPGIIAVNVATFIGYNKKGVIGAVTATAGVVAPSVIIILVIAHWIGSFSDVAWIQKALAGINIAVAALLTQAVVSFCKKTIKDIIGAAIAAVSFAVIFIWDINPVWVIAAAAAAGIALAPHYAKRQMHTMREQRRTLQGTEEQNAAAQSLPAQPQNTKNSAEDGAQ